MRIYFGLSNNPKLGNWFDSGTILEVLWADFFSQGLFFAPASFAFQALLGVGAARLMPLATLGFFDRFAQKLKEAMFGRAFVAVLRTATLFLDNQEAIIIDAIVQLAQNATLLGLGEPPAASHEKAERHLGFHLIHVLSAATGRARRLKMKFVLYDFSVHAIFCYRTGHGRYCLVCSWGIAEKSAKKFR